MTYRQKPVLSIIVANYNNEKYLEDCIESILKQTYKDYEVIISDDCSTDDSPGIIRDYEKRFPGVIKGIFNAANRGVARTRHEGILQAQGEYITTLDGDDYYCDSRKLEAEMALVLSYREKDNKDIVAFSNIILVRGDKTIIKEQGNSENIKQGMVFDDIITRSCMIPRDFIMKREQYFEIGGYDFQFPIYEDWDLKIRLAKEYEFYYTGIHGTAYRRHGTGLSSNPIPVHVKWLKKAFKKNLHLVEKSKRKRPTEDFSKYLKGLKRSYINNHLKKELDLKTRQGKKANALGLCLKIILLDREEFTMRSLLSVFSSHN